MTVTNISSDWPTALLFGARPVVLCKLNLMLSSMRLEFVENYTSRGANLDNLLDSNELKIHSI